MESIKRFAEDDPEVAKYYPEDRDFLLKFEPSGVHYQVVERVEEKEPRTP